MENLKNIILKLRTMYPDAGCELQHSSPFELLVAAILSAQCTDKQVNKITEILFEKYKTPQDFANLNEEELIPYIYSSGFFRNKAKNIISASRDIVSRFNGNVPSKMEDLTSLAGVGVKVASVVQAVGFNIPALAVDTHVFRVSNRLDIVNENTPIKTHKKLIQIVNKKDWINFHYLLVIHGRYTCKAKKPECHRCLLTQDCKYFKEKINV